MTDYRLPPGMTADRPRELAEDMAWRGVDSLDAETVSAWADAIDPPKSIVTDEMVEAVRDEAASVVASAATKRLLEAAVECGWTPPADPMDDEVELVAEVDRLRAAIEEALLHRRWSVLADAFEGTTDDD